MPSLLPKAQVRAERGKLPGSALRKRASHVLPGALYLGFTVTGFACVLPGVLLPALLQAWGWDDRHGGRFFLLIAGGSAVGPLWVNRRPQRSVAVGFFLAAAAAVSWCLDPHLAQGSGVVWGLGLGMAMTGISLVSQVAMHGGTKALIRLNFLWALGAFLCPILVGPLLGTESYVGVLWGATVLLAISGLGSLAAAVSTSVNPREGRPDRSRAAWSFAYWDRRGIPLGLLTAAALATGIEASAGAWLATYAERSTQRLDTTIAAPACLWAGLLCSRACGWFLHRPLDRQPALRTLLLIVLLATAGLVLPFHRVVLLGSSFALGFGLGPLYPALLGRVLAFRQTSLVFFAAGLASSVMPWATGALSTRSGLLRIGLLVPMVGASIMTLSGWRLPEPEANP